MTLSSGKVVNISKNYHRISDPIAGAAHAIEKESKIMDERTSLGEIIIRTEIDDKSNHVTFTASGIPSDYSEYIHFCIENVRLGDFTQSREIKVSGETILQQNSFEVTLITKIGRIPFRKEGEFFYVTSLMNPNEYYDRIQLAGTRVKSNLSMRLGALTAYNNFPNTTTRASALTVYGHRIVDLLLSRRDAINHFDLNRYLTWTTSVLAECSKEISTANFRWDLIRWSISLATVSGNICIALNRLDQARTLFKFCYTHADKVAVSPVSSLNVVNGQLFYALLSFMSGDAHESRMVLRDCISSYKSVVAAQDMLVNVWVIGDLLNSAKAVRQAFILMVQLGLDDRSPSGIVDANSKFEISALQSPIFRLMQLGFCEEFGTRIHRFP